MRLHRGAGARLVVGFLALVPALGVLLVAHPSLLAATGAAAAAAAAADHETDRETILTFSAGDLDLRTAGGRTAVGYRGAVSGTGTPGSPDLPALTVFLAGPAAATVGKVEVEVLERVSLGVHRLPAVAVPVPPGEEPPAADLDREIAASDASYPDELVRFAGRSALRGRNLLAFAVHPVLWRPRSGELELVTRLRVRYELVPAPAIALPRYRVVAETEARFARGLESLLGKTLGPDALRELKAAAPSAAPVTGLLEVAGPGPFQPTFRPTTDGSPVEYVIVTSEALAGTFGELANWKTQKGVQAAVRTVEWIDQTYPNGVDRAERVRFFIRDAYQNWGTLFVLLGGDTDVLPVRYATSYLFTDTQVPTDYYYMCLEGNWNADGDSYFGEAFQTLQETGDDVDLTPEVYAGRAPVSTLAEAQTFVDKTVDYDKSPASGNGYPASILYLAERLFPSWDGAEIAEEADDLVPPWFKRVKLYEEHADWPGSLPETLESTIDSTNNGFGIVHHIGHGFRNTMSVGPDNEVMNNADANGLTNGTRQSVVFSINCSSASIDFNSIGERWVKNPNGGSIAYIGTSRSAFANTSRNYQQLWYGEVFVDSVRSLGENTALARLPFLGFSTYDNSYRWTMFIVTLIGDPEVDLFTNATPPMSVAHSGSYVLGTGPVAATVTSAGSPVSGVTVTLWKEGEAYARATTGANGMVSLPFLAETPGSATLTAHKSYYVPYQAAVTVTAGGGPHLYVLATELDDDSAGASSGDGDGLADRGETIELQVTLRNGGGAAATGVSSTLTVEDPDGWVTITTSSVSYGTIGAGGTSAGGSRFVIAFDSDAPEAFQPLFTLNLSSDQGASSDVFVLPVRRPYLEHYEHVIDDAAPRGNGNGLVESGEQIWYMIALRNTGQETASSVAATLTVVRASDLQPEPNAVVTDGQSSFGTVAVDATVTGDRFVFLLNAGLDPATILLKVTFTDAQGPVREEFLDVIPPGTPASLVTFGSPTSIRVVWTRSSDLDVLGYDIFRSANPGGPFLRLNTFLAEGSAVFEDGSLPPLARFYYKVMARDASLNQSSQSAYVIGTTNPPAMSGWPVAIGQQGQASLQIAKTAGGPDYELFTASDFQYGWHADGIEIVDGDNDPRTSGVYAPDGFHTSKGFGATCALGDMDGDGTVEVANVGWFVPEAYVWNNQGELMPGWPQSVMGDFNWPSPVMADLDLDRDLELVVWAAKGGRLFAWHHDGTEVADGDQNPGTNGVLVSVTAGAPSFCYSSPAVANLDADPEPEIVFCVNLSTDDSGGIYVVNGDGSAVPGWPLFTGSPTFPSEITASPAIGDLDQDGTNEIIVASERGGGRVHVLRASGADFPGWPKSVAALTPQVRTSSPVLADLDGDSYLDVIFAASDGRLWAWNRNGAVLSGFPVTYYTAGGEATQSTPTIGDIDGEAQMEILLGDESGKVHAYNHNGTPVNGFPIQLNGEARGSVAIWDYDRDGLVEVGILGWEANVFIWDLPYAWNQAGMAWAFFRHDVANTGYVGSQVLPVGIAAPGPAGAAIAPRVAAVYPARPNPFNPRTTIAFDVPGLGTSPVTLAIYDVEGRMVARLVDGGLPGGRHEVVWDGRGSGGQPQATGVYFYRVTIGDYHTARKLTLVK